MSAGLRPSSLTSSCGEVMALAISVCHRAGLCWSVRVDAVIIRGPSKRRAFCRRRCEKEMASYTTSEIRGGMKLLIDNEPYAVVDNEFVKPGKGQAFNRIRIRNLKTGRTIERTWRSGESKVGCVSNVADVGSTSGE